MVYAVIDTNIFVSALISTIIEHVKENGIDSSRFPYDGEMPDEDDRVFYEVCLSKEDSFLLTGNLKHFPPKTASDYSSRNDGNIGSATPPPIIRKISFV